MGRSGGDRNRSDFDVGQPQLYWRSKVGSMIFNRQATPGQIGERWIIALRLLPATTCSKQNGHMSHDFAFLSLWIGHLPALPRVPSPSHRSSPDFVSLYGQAFSSLENYFWALNLRRSLGIVARIQGGPGALHTAPPTEFSVA